jgi:hypothetical protein
MSVVVFVRKIRDAVMHMNARDCAIFYGAYLMVIVSVVERMCPVPSAVMPRESGKRHRRQRKRHDRERRNAFFG